MPFCQSGQKFPVASLKVFLSKSIKLEDLQFVSDFFLKRSSEQVNCTFDSPADKILQSPEIFA